MHPQSALEALRGSHPLMAQLLGYELTDGTFAGHREAASMWWELYRRLDKAYRDHVEDELRIITTMEERSLGSCLEDLTLFNLHGAAVDNDAWYDQRAAFVSMHLDFLLRGFGQRRLDRALSQLAPHLGGAFRSCDVGAGCGYFAGRLLAAYERASVTLCDRSIVAQRYAAEYLERKRVAARAKVERADLAELPAPDHHFDLVVAMEVLEHTPHADQAARELRRVLKPGGVLLVSVPIDLDIPMHPVVFPDADSVLLFFEAVDLECCDWEMVETAQTDAAYHALPDFVGCFQGIFARR